MIDEETKIQMEKFLDELRIIAADKTISDFSALYKKYPMVKVGIRRALFYLQKQDK